MTSTEEEDWKVKELQEAGRSPIIVAKRPHRPQVLSHYIEPDLIPDSTFDLDVIFRERGNVLYTRKSDSSVRLAPVRFALSRRQYTNQVTPKSYTLTIPSMERLPKPPDFACPIELSIMRLSTFPTTRCDDAVEAIGGNFRISLDMDCGYWQVTLSPSVRGKTASFVPDNKKRFPSCLWDT